MTGETRSHALLASRGLAPPLLARFGNGLLYRFIRGQVASPEILTQPPIWRGIARRLAQWHAVLPIDDPATNPRASEDPEGTTSCLDAADSHIKPFVDTPVGLDDITPIEPRQNGTTLWTVMQKWILALPASTDKERSRRKLLQKEFERIVAEFDDRKGLGVDGVSFYHSPH